MQKEEMEEIAKMAADVVISQCDLMLSKRTERCYQDIELIMKNYRKLKSRYECLSIEFSEDKIGLVPRVPQLTMRDVERLLAAYESLCITSDLPEDSRRWEALFLRYISTEKISTDDIAERLHIDKRTFYRDIHKALEDLAVLLFGLEAIKLQNRER